MAAVFHGQAQADMLESLLQLATIPSGTVQLRYLNGYTPNPDDSYWSDISSNEASGAPTVAVSSLAVSYDNTNNRTTIDFADPSSSDVTTTTDGIALILNTGTDSTSPIIYTADITELNPFAGTLSLTLDSNGLCAYNTTAT